MPFFVYGTLRQGQGNHCLVAASVQGIRTARLTGHSLYSAGLPYAAPSAGPASSVAGDLLLIRPDAYPAVLDRLDRLEGYRPPLSCLYVRTRCVAEYLDRPGVWLPCPAWVYLAGGSFRLDPDLLVDGGDWAVSRDAA